MAKKWTLGLYFLYLFMAIPSWGQAEMDSPPDPNLVRKIITLPFPQAKKELDQLPDHERIRYGLFLATIHVSQFRNDIAGFQFCEYAEKTAADNHLPAGRIFFTKAYIYERQNEMEKTMACLDQAAAALRDANDIDFLKSCLSWLGTTTYNYGLFEKSRKTHEELIQLCIKTTDLEGETKALFDLGEVYYRLGNLPLAKQAADRAMEYYQSRADHKGMADCLKLLGNVLSAQQKQEEAKAYYSRAVQAYEEAEDPHGQGNCNFNLGLICIDLKQYSEAVEHLMKARDFYMQSESQTGVGIAQMELGRTFHYLQEYSEAQRCFEKAELLLAKNSKHRLAQTKEYFGDMRVSQKQPEQAMKLYVAAADLYLEINSKKDEQRVRIKSKNLRVQ